MENTFTFDDVLIKPKISTIISRKDVDLSTNIGDLKINIPVISANMDTVTSREMAIAMYAQGAISCLPRFLSIEKNAEDVKHILSNNSQTVGSIGLGEQEFERACALIEAGLRYLCIDVAHGAQITVVEQYNKIVEKFKDVAVMVGNFATGESIADFKKLVKTEPIAFKVGIGGGSACLTRTQTGCGVPQLSAVIDCVKKNPTSYIISDGGKKTPGDISKALAAGAKLVMLGAMLAGTDEAYGEIIDDENGNKFKKYRGSASQESYEAQKKVASWRTFEGDSFLVPYKGPVKNILQNISGGLRSAFTYVGASNLVEFQNKAEFVKISSSAKFENIAHGKYRGK